MHGSEQAKNISAMASRVPSILCLLSLASLVAFTNASKRSPTVAFNRSSFPDGFLFGAGSAAYQYEGATLRYGRGPSIWDNFIKEQPGKIADRSNADIANDFYHRYKEDIKLMKYIGLDSFRFSISWTRILPKGKLSGGVNQLGVQFYNDLINELLDNGIQPFVTLLHFDPPQALEEEYVGLLSPKIVADYLDFANFCFETFGDRVKHWVTINEALIFVTRGYNSGTLAPGRCSNYIGNCPAGNSATEPYIAAHHLLLSHAGAVRLYKKNYQAKQKGQIGITVVSNWFVPKSNKSSDRKAASRALDFNLGWIASPVTFGHYPSIMRKLVGNRLPKFTEEQSRTLKGSYDFLSVNYYTANYAQSAPSSNNANLSYSTDGLFTLSADKNGIPIGTPTAFNGFYIYPKGLNDIVLYIKNKYNNPTIYVTENGMADSASLPLKTAIKDTTRIRFISGHLSSLLKAIKAGVKVKGYHVWSSMDDFEWNSGYTVRFGLTYVDYKDNLKRYLKASAYWFKKFLQ